MRERQVMLDEDLAHQQVEANYLLLPRARPRVSACIGLGRLGSGGGVGGAVCAIGQFYAVDAMAMIQRITSMVSRPLATWKKTASCSSPSRFSI